MTALTNGAEYTTADLAAFAADDVMMLDDNALGNVYRAATSGRHGAAGRILAAIVTAEAAERRSSQAGDYAAEAAMARRDR